MTLYQAKQRMDSMLTNLLSRTSFTSQHLQTNIDVSNTKNIKIYIDDICSVTSKLVKSLRLASRNRWTTKLLDYP